MKTPEPVILYTSAEAAQQVTVTGWRSRHGHFYGENEHIARWDGCTHMVCECGAAMSKGYTKCDACRAKAADAAWEKLPLVEWDGGPLCIFRDDTYFWDIDDVERYCDEHHLKASELHLVVCDPVMAREIDADHWSDDLGEDGDLPPDIEAALEVFNAVIRAHKAPLSWIGGDQRVVLPDFPELPAMSTIQHPVDGNGSPVEA